MKYFLFSRNPPEEDKDVKERQEYFTTKGKKRKEDQDIFLTTEDTENTEKKGGRENGVIQDY